jgi:pilus assembly protein FimV
LIKGSNVHKSKINKISLAVCLAFMPIYGLAAGLGKLNINSGLGEPLKAEIELLSVTPDELSTLSAAVASEEAYAVQGIPRLGIHNNIKVELIKNADGSPALRLRSLQPIVDPYLDMLIQVDWASGRLLREYTILLDPPEYKQEVIDEPVYKSNINKPVVDQNLVNEPSRIGSSAETAHQATPKSKKSKKTISKLPAPLDESPATANDRAEVTSHRGDTLNSIAKDVQVEGVSLDQMLVGIFEANKNAFVDGNMNRLKVGQIIKVPPKEALIAVDTQQARKEVKVHAANWNAYRNNLAGNVLAAPVAEGTEQRQSASGKIAAAEDKAAIAKAGPQDVVKLSAGGNTLPKEGKTGADFDAKVLALQEEATARDKALKDSQQRTAALEAQIADMQKLLVLKNQAMAGAQKNAEAAAKPIETKPAATAAAATPPAAAVSTTAADTAKPASTPATTVTSDAELAKKQEAAAKVAKKATPAVKAPVQPEPVAETSFLENLLGSVDLLMLGGVAGIALLGSGWMYLRNKRRRDLDSFERGILTSGGLRANTVFGNTTGTASTADTSFLTDFAQSADGSMIDTNDVDPIAEAEVYMAYGRDAQAEEILKDAISKEPKRYELHLKLLEMYVARRDISAFEAIAGELYTTLGADDPTWAKVAELGVMVEPDNPLYDISQIPSSVTATEPGIESSALTESALNLNNALDFSFADKPTLNTDTVNNNELEKDSFDFGELKTEPASKAADDAVMVEQPENKQVESNNLLASADDSPADNSMDFDFPDLGSFGSAVQEPVKIENELPNNPFSQPALEVAAAGADVDKQELELPASTESVDMNNEVKNEDFGLDFNFTASSAETPAIELPEPVSDAADFNFEGFAEAVTQADDAAAEVSMRDNVDFNFEGFGETTATSNQEASGLNALEGIDLNFGSAEDTAVQPQSVDPIAAKQPDTKFADMSFNIPLTDDQDEFEMTLESASANQKDSASFDLSAISLDLTDSEPQVAQVGQSTADNIESPQAVAENPDVDIKLDLVKVYIDMEDVEGARDLLDEVLKEGGPQQRATAESLLASLG